MSNFTRHMKSLSWLIEELKFEPEFALKAYEAFLDRYEREERMDKIQEIIKLIKSKADDCDDEENDDDCGCFCGCCNDDMY